MAADGDAAGPLRGAGLNVDRIVAKLGQPGADRRKLVRLLEEALEESGDLAAIEPLVRVMLEDTDALVRARGREALLKFARGAPGGDIAAALASTGDPSVIPRLLDALEESVDQRRGALGVVCALTLFGRSAMGPLLQRLEGAEWPYRNEIASALRLIASSGSDLLLAALTGDWPHVRSGAAFALAGLPPGVAVGPLVIALTDPEPEVAAAAAAALGEVGDDRAVEPLLEAAASPHAGIRAAAARSLGSVSGATVVESLVALLSDEDSGVVVSAQAALAAIGRPAVEPLAALLETDDDRLRAVAAGALAGIGTAAFAPLRRALRSKQWRVRQAAATALGDATEMAINDSWGFEKGRTVTPSGHVERAKRTKAVDRNESGLVSLLDDDVFAVRRAAATALGAAGDPRTVSALAAVSGATVVESLVALLSDEDSGVVVSAQAALAAIGRPAVEPLAALLETDDDRLRAVAAGALAGIGTAAFAPLRRALRSKQWRVRQAAATALGDATGMVTNDLQGFREDKRTKAVDRNVSGLVSLLDDDVFAVRRAAATALGGVGDPRTVSALAAVLQRDREPARAAAAEALLRIKASIHEPLLAALASSDAVLREIVTSAIAQYFAVFDASVPEPEATDPTALAALRATLRRPWLPPERFIDLMLRINADRPEILVAALATPAPAFQRLLRSQLAWRVERTRGDVPSWFDVDWKPWGSLDLEPAKRLASALTLLTADPDGAVRDAAVRALAGVQRILEYQRTTVKYRRALGPDVWFPAHPDAATATGMRALEQVAAEAQAKVAAERPEPRYADLTIHRDGGGSKPYPAGYALVTDEWYDLEVAVRTRPKGVPPEGARRPVREPDAVGRVELLVTAEGDGIEIEEPVARLMLPLAGDSTENACFRIRPETPGRGAVRIRIFWELNLVEVATLYAAIVGRFDDPVTANPETLLVRQERLEHEYTGLGSLEPRAMHVDVTRVHGSLVFRFTFPVGDDRGAVFCAPVPLESAELEHELGDIRALWYDIALGADYATTLEGEPDQLRQQLRRLAIAGQHLWVALFMRQITGSLARVGDLLKRHPPAPGSVIQVSVDRSAADFVFPWALLYDRPVPPTEAEPIDPQGFWGFRYVVEQQIPAPPRQTLRRVERVDPVRMGFMLWKQFRNAREEIELMRSFERDSGGGLEVNEPPITDAGACFDLLDQDNRDILYFYTHGHARKAAAPGEDELELFRRRYERLSGDDPRREDFRFLYESIHRGTFEADRSYIEFTTGKVYLDELYARVRRLSRHPVIVLNMCESAQLVPSLSESFIHFFLDRGAAAVIGTECPMTIAFAHPFAEALLSGLLRGEDVGDALRSARRALLDLRNPLGLGYTLYGSATTRFRPPPLRTVPLMPPPDGRDE